MRPAAFVALCGKTTQDLGRVAGNAALLGRLLRWVWPWLVLLLCDERPSQGRMGDQAVDEAAANRGVNGWTSSDAVGDADDFGYSVPFLLV